MRMHRNITQVVESETVHSQIEFKSSQVYTETTDNHVEAYRMCPECAPEASMGGRGRGAGGRQTLPTPWPIGKAVKPSRRPPIAPVVGLDRFALLN